MNAQTKIFRLLALLFVVAMIAAACGSDSDTDASTDSASDSASASEPAGDDDASASEPAEDDAMEDEDEACSELTDVVAATVNPNDLLNYSLNEGLFEANCLNVSLAEGLNGPGIVAGLAAGEIDFGFVAGVPVATSVTNAGQPIRITSVRSAAVPGNDFVVLVANNDSGVSGPADFEGKNIGIRSPGSLCTVIMKQAMINAGVEDVNNAATYIQGESNGDLAEQLRSGDIDVTCLTYPFAGSVVDDVTIVGNTESAFPGGIAVGVTATSDAFADENPDLVAAWDASLTAAADVSNADEAAWRALLPDITSMSPEQAEASILPLNVGGGSVDEWDFQPLWDAVEALGLTEGPVDVDGVFG